jgi:hypothetical protein
MKRIIFPFLSIVVTTLISSGQTPDFHDSIAFYFAEIKTNTILYKDLWNRDLYGPVLLVEPDTRRIYANSSDSAGILKQNGEIFTGNLPGNINISNTALKWNGTSWAMIMLPLPQDKAERLDLISHELFHLAQPALGFHLTNQDNNHLDTRDGRIYFRLEMEALRQFLTDSTNPVNSDHLANAFYFRRIRYTLTPGARSNENKLELNEGLASYTGIMMSGRTMNDTKNYFIQKLTDYLNWPTLVRSFAYLTTPLYGFILSTSKRNWNCFISDTTNLTDYFVMAFNISVPVKLCSECLEQYKFKEILNEETAREEDKKQTTVKYLKMFVEQPHLDINLEKMNISFDPRNIIPLEGYGTVYPTLRITDNWGILTVTGGALLETDWGKVTVSEPAGIGSERISGNGWTLDLKTGYRIEKNSTDNNYVLKKN